MRIFIENLIDSIQMYFENDYNNSFYYPFFGADVRVFRNENGSYQVRIVRVKKEYNNLSAHIAAELNIK